MEAAAAGEDALVRSEAARYRQAIAQVLTWVAIALVWSITVVLILDRLGVPATSLVASAAVVGAAVASAPSRWYGT
jgi:moderate conductance mechanosensitive channel